MDRYFAFGSPTDYFKAGEAYEYAELVIGFVRGCLDG